VPVAGLEGAASSAAIFRLRSRQVIVSRTIPGTNPVNQQVERVTVIPEFFAGTSLWG
jgi:hypothetical protein